MLNMASATHFLATTYVEPGRAEVESPLLETDRTPNPMRDEMYLSQLEVADGKVTVPAAPGLGVEPDKKAMEQFCVQETEKK
jgi:D-galactarolactone cycloisomerase